MTQFSKPLPVTILTGYLGAGKTTLLNRILSESHGLRLAVVLNEFGEIPIDHEFVLNLEQETYTMSNGCICCSRRGDLVATLDDLLDDTKAFDRIIIETTGVAEPGPIVMSFLEHPEAGERFCLDGLVTLLDARNLPAQLDRESEAAHQIAYADLLVLNKCDLVDETELAMLGERVAAINPGARLILTEMAEVDLGDLLDIGGFDPLRAAENLERSGSNGISSPNTGSASVPHRQSPALHAGDVASESIVLDGAISLEAFERWHTELARIGHADIFRMKGVLALDGVDRRYLFQGVHDLWSGQYGDRWEEGMQRSSRIVVIGRNLGRYDLQAGFRGCLASVR
jgi:G3E family GTPase